MKRNKFLALMMAFVMLVTALTGCGGNNDADTGKNNDTLKIVIYIVIFALFFIFAPKAC